MEAEINPLRKKLIEVSAENLLAEAHVAQPPSPVGKLLEQWADVHTYCSGKGAGFCCCAPTEFHVFINAERISENDTYHLACELGHYLLGHFNRREQRTDIWLNKIAVEAEYFADCLLMPEKWLQIACLGGVMAESRKNELADRFCVPLEKLNKRLADLGIGGRS